MLIGIQFNYGAQHNFKMLGLLIIIIIILAESETKVSTLSNCVHFQEVGIVSDRFMGLYWGPHRLGGHTGVPKTMELRPY